MYMEKEQDVIVAKSAGFCPGVKRAIDKVLELEAAGKKPIQVWTCDDIGSCVETRSDTESILAPMQTDRRKIVHAASDEDHINTVAAVLRDLM